MNFIKLNTIHLVFRFCFLAFILSSSIQAENDKEEKRKPVDSLSTQISEDIVIKELHRGSVSKFIFHYNHQLLYTILFDGASVERSFFSVEEFNGSIVEHDLNKNGKVDAIRIAKNDDEFIPLYVKRANDSIEIILLPENWNDGSFVKYDNNYDTFIRYVKKLMNE